MLAEGQCGPGLTKLSKYILHTSRMYLHQLCLPMQLHTYYTSLLGNVDALLSFFMHIMVTLKYLVKYKYTYVHRK